MPSKEVRSPAPDGKQEFHRSGCKLTLDRAEVIACQAAVFEWAESFDTKDWERLAECVAPELYVRKATSSAPGFTSDFR